MAAGIRITLLVIVVSAGLATIMGKGSGGGQGPVEVASIAIEPTTFPLGLPIGFPVQLEAKLALSDGKTITRTEGIDWSSSDSAVAEVTSSGLVTGKIDGGPITITAAAGGKAATLALPIRSGLMLTNLAVTPASGTVLPIGSARQHVATATWSDGVESTTYDFTTEVEWRSENESVARVDAPGSVRGVSAGNANISAYERITDTTSNAVRVDVADPVSLIPPKLLIAPVQTSGQNLFRGFRFQATAEIVYGDGTRKDVTETADWTTTTTGILSVSNTAGSKGLVSATGAGLGTISVTAEGASATQNYRVNDTSIDSLQVAVPQLPVGLEYRVRVTAILTDADMTSVDVTDFVIFSVVDTTIASIGNDGDTRAWLTGLKAGSTELGVSLPDSDFAATADISFVDAALDSIAVRPNQPGTLPAGRKQPFTAIGFFDGLQGAEFDATRQVTFSSSSPGVASVSNALADKGAATAMTPGTTEITASYDGIGSGAGVRLEVTPAALQSIVVAPVNKTLPRNAGTQQFQATGTYSDSSEKNLTNSVSWTSANAAVARFDNQGRKGLAIVDATGTTTIRAALSGAPESTAGETSLTVAAAAPVSLTIGGGNAVEVGDELQLTATAAFDDMSQQDVTLVAGWSASNTRVSVANGKVVGRLPGTATITAALSSSVRDSVQVTIDIPPGLGPTGELGVSVEEGGRVVADVGGFSCDGPDTCTANFSRGSIVTLTAIPDPGWKLDEWDPCEAPAGLTCAVTIRATNFLRAEFDPL
ncbi:MAG: Ig-like domain-containing protein [Gammaproteobacteria bacterium]